MSLVWSGEGKQANCWLIWSIRKSSVVLTMTDELTLKNSCNGWGTKMRKEVFIGRTVHDYLLEHCPELIEEIFEREPEPIWQFAGVSVRMSPALFDSYTRSTKDLR